MNFLITRKLGDIISEENPFSFVENSIISGAEIMLSKPELMDIADISEIQEKCRGLYLTAHLPFYDLNLASVDDHISEYSLSVIVKGLDFCNKMNIDRAVAHLGFNVKLAGKAALKWKEKFFRQKMLIENLAGKKGIKIIWENTYEETFELFDEMLLNNCETLFCLDTGHCNCFAGFSAEDFLDRYKSSVIHLHLHDNNGAEDSHLAPGAGSINFRSVLSSADRSAVDNAVFEIDPVKFVENENSIKQLFETEEK